jgi:predicted N-acetyltransferase YhbS
VNIRVAHLFEHAECNPTVARWIYEEFWADKQRHTAESLDALLRQATRPDRIPLSLLALHNSNPVGTINLIENDDEDRPHLTPWLAALYVKPEFRRQGIGSLLVRTLQSHARRLGIRGLYLGTDNPAFYSRLGSVVVEPLDRGSCIMFLECSSNVPAGIDTGLLP